MRDAASYAHSAIGKCRREGITPVPSLRSFFIVSPTDQQVHCWSWIKKHMPSDPHLHLEDVSWKYTGEFAAVSWSR